MFRINLNIFVLRNCRWKFFHHRFSHQPKAERLQHARPTRHMERQPTAYLRTCILALQGSRHHTLLRSMVPNGKMNGLNSRKQAHTSYAIHPTYNTVKRTDMSFAAPCMVCMCLRRPIQNRNRYVPVQCTSIRRTGDRSLSRIWSKRNKKNNNDGVLWYDFWYLVINSKILESMNTPLNVRCCSIRLCQ